MTALARRVADSPAARDLRDVRLASPAGVVVALLLLALVVVLVMATRGEIATWSGYVPVSYLTPPDLTATPGGTP